MKGLPYFRWYPADAEMDAKYRALDDAEVGFYLRCLNYAWINGGIPADSQERARVLGRSKSVADKRWVRVGLCFTPSPNDPAILVNPRQEVERELAAGVSASASKSANARWSARTADAMRTHSEGNARAYDSDSASDSKKETSLQTDDFNKFLEVCDLAEMRGSETDLRAARSEWARLSLADRLAACQGIKERVAAGELADPGFRPLPQNYLKNKTWQRTVREKRDPGLEREHAKRNEVLQLTKIFGGMK